MAVPFESARRKLARAKDHLAEFKRQALLYLEQNPCEIFTEPHPHNPKQVICKLRLVKQFSSGFPEIAGDIVDNLRAALDHAMYGVAIASGCTKPLHAYFPFAKDAADLELKLRGNCKDVPKEIYPLLRSYEPYKGGSILLWALNRVCNANKHKLVIPIGGATFQAGVSVTGTGFFTAPYAPVWDSTKNEMELLTVERGTKLNGQFNIAVYIAFGEVEGVHGQPAIETMDAFVDMVETILIEIETEACRLGFFN